MCVGEQAPKSSKYDFSKIYIQNYKNQKILGRVRWVRQLVEARFSVSFRHLEESTQSVLLRSSSYVSVCNT